MNAIMYTSNPSCYRIKQAYTSNPSCYRIKQAYTSNPSCYRIKQAYTSNPSCYRIKQAYGIAIINICELNVNVNYQDEHNCTALTYSAHNNINAAKVLLEFDAATNIKTIWG